MHKLQRLDHASFNKLMVEPLQEQQTLKLMHKHHSLLESLAIKGLCLFSFLRLKLIERLVKQFILLLELIYPNIA
jgi:hypothetical protein